MERGVDKKEWTAPEAVCYGSVAELTQQVAKSKTLGISDDFAVPGISDAV
jgi:hypothetical protein